MQCSFLNPFLFFVLSRSLSLLLSCLSSSPQMVAVPPLGIDVLLMTSQFSSVHNFYIRVKSLQLNSYG